MKGGRKGKKRDGETQRTYLAFQSNTEKVRNQDLLEGAMSKSVHEPD